MSAVVLSTVIILILAHSRHSRSTIYDTIRYGTIEEFNVDSKAEYSA